MVPQPTALSPGDWVRHRERGTLHIVTEVRLGKYAWVEDAGTRATQGFRLGELVPHTPTAAELEADRPPAFADGERVIVVFEGRQRFADVVRTLPFGERVVCRVVEGDLPARRHALPGSYSARREVRRPTEEELYHFLLGRLA